MARRRYGRRGRRGGRRSSNALPWIIVGFLFIGLGIYFVAKNIDNGGSCGERGVDEEKKGFCQVSNTDYGQLVIVAGNTQNTPVPNLDFTKGDLRNLLEGVFYSAEAGGAPDINIISVASGNDYIDLKTIKPAKNISASNDNLVKLGRAINEAIKTEPKRGNADYLGAILKAKRSFRDSDSKKMILVIGSGYSDSGYLNFANGDILSKYVSDKNYVKNLLNNDDRIKANYLEGVSVQWYDLGQVINPQRSLDSYRSYTEEIYEEVFSYMGASGYKLNLESKTKKQEMDTKHAVNPVYMDELKIGDYISIDDTVSRFLDNQTVLQNYDKVRDYLYSFVQKFKNSDYSLSVTGYVDRCDPSDSRLQALSSGRAEVIKSILVGMGVASERIETHGEAGPPPQDFNVPYSCNAGEDDNIPNEEQRTVRIVVK